jgi:hypothetical protein
VSSSTGTVSSPAWTLRHYRERGFADEGKLWNLSSSAVDGHLPACGKGTHEGLAARRHDPRSRVTARCRGVPDERRCVKLAPLFAGTAVKVKVQCRL